MPTPTEANIEIKDSVDYILNTYHPRAVAGTSYIDLIRKDAPLAADYATCVEDYCRMAASLNSEEAVGNYTRSYLYEIRCAFLPESTTRELRENVMEAYSLYQGWMRIFNLEYYDQYREE